MKNLLVALGLLVVVIGGAIYISNSTLGWKMYSNEQYGFEFKYPKSFSVEERYNEENKVLHIEVQNLKNDGSWYESVSIIVPGFIQFVNQGSIEENIEQLKKYYSLEEYKEIKTNNGVAFYGVVEAPGPALYPIAHLVGENLIVDIVLTTSKSLTEAENFINKMVSTFKFTK